VSGKIPTPTIVLCVDTTFYFFNVLKSVILFCGSLVSCTFSKIILYFLNLVTFPFHWIHIKGKEIKFGMILFKIMLIFQSVINAGKSCIYISDFIFQWFNLYGMMMIMIIMILRVLDCTIYTRIFNFQENLLTE
jgi:hypothetical protein